MKTIQSNVSLFKFNSSFCINVTYNMLIEYFFAVHEFLHFVPVCKL